MPAIDPGPVDVAASLATFDVREGFTQHYNGLDVWKTADDMCRYERVIAATRPELVVETGTKWGGFAHWLADRHKLLVVTIDVAPILRGREFERVVSIKGDSVHPATVAQVAALAAGLRTMVVLDSDHHAGHVAAEIRAYGPMVSPGCHLVVEDGLADLVEVEPARRFGVRIPEEGGPLAAVEHELVGVDGWERDLEVEGMTSVSHSPGGWWRRV